MISQRFKWGDIWYIWERRNKDTNLLTHLFVNSQEISHSGSHGRVCLVGTVLLKGGSCWVHDAKTGKKYSYFFSMTLIFYTCLYMFSQFLRQVNWQERQRRVCLVIKCITGTGRWKVVINQRTVFDGLNINLIRS